MTLSGQYFVIINGRGKCSTCSDIFSSAMDRFSLVFLACLSLTLKDEQKAAIAIFEGQSDAYGAMVKAGL